MSDVLTGGDERCPQCGSDDVATDHEIIEVGGEWVEGTPDGLMCFACDHATGTLAPPYRWSRAG